MKRTLKSKETTVANELKTKKPKPAVSEKTVKPVTKKTIVSAPKIKPPPKKTNSADSDNKSRNQNKKLTPPVLTQKTKVVKAKKLTTVAAKPVMPPIKKVQSDAAVKAKTKSVKTQPIISNKKIKVENKRFKPITGKIQKPITAETKVAKSRQIKSTSPKVKVAPIENKIKPKEAKLACKPKSQKVVKAIETKIEPTKPTVVRKPRKKKVKPIGAAIFRGKKDRYGFEVFPLDAELEDVSAIYVISKRKTDKLKKGHHKLVCIGQTESVLGEIKRHKKGKCVKKNQANVISILPEENEKKRLRIETDLKAAHTVVCYLE